MSEILNNYLKVLNNIGQGFCEYASEMFIQSSILILFLLLLDMLIRRRVRATFRYGIWMLVLVKLVLPPSLSLPTGIGYWRGDILPAESIISPQISITDKPEIVQDEIITASQNEADYSPAPIERNESYGIGAQNSTMVELSESAQIQRTDMVPLTWQAIIFVLWLMGVIVLSILLIQRILFVRKLIFQSEPVPEELKGLMNQCCEKLGINRKVEIRAITNIQSPAVCGLFRLVILIPGNLLDKLPHEKIQTVLIHELAHLKRVDLWVNCAQTLLQIVYFYNPFVWFANFVIRRIREQAVDEMVLVALGAEAESYSNTLIDIAEMTFYKTSLSLRLIGVVESKKALQARIKNMLARPVPKSARLGLSGLLVILITAAIMLPMAKAQKVDSNTDKGGKEENPFTATLSNGVIVELLGVCNHPSEGKQWWRPDGTVLAQAPYYTTGSISTDEKQGYVYYEFALKLNDPDKTSFFWTIPGSRHGSDTGSPRDESSRQIKSLKAYATNLSKEQKNTTVLIGATGAQWKTIVTYKPEDHEETYSTNGYDIAFGDAYTKDNRTLLPLVHNYNRKDRQYAIRVIAVTKSDQVRTSGYSGSGGNNLNSLTYIFSGLPLEEIKEFQFQIRPYQWITFKNVSLRPGVNTDVKVEFTGTQIQSEKEESNSETGLPEPVGYWKFDGNANDATGVRNGIVNGAALTEGISGQAYYFDGNDDYITIEDISLGAFTFSGWVKPETGSLNNRRIFLLDQDIKFCALQGNAGGGLSFGIAGGTHEGNIEINEYDWEFEPDKWTHIAVTFEGSTAKIYKDGRLTETGLITQGPLEGTFYIGGTTSHRGAFWHGAIDEVSIYDSVLSTSDIDKLYNMVRPSVLLVIGRDKMTFEGKEVTWEQLPKILEKIPNRSQTVFCLAIDSEEITIAQLNQAKAKAEILIRQFGFEYLSYVGVHPLDLKVDSK